MRKRKRDRQRGVRSKNIDLYTDADLHVLESCYIFVTLRIVYSIKVVE